MEYKVPELLDPQGGYGYSQPTSHNVRTKAVTAKSTGLPDQRVKTRSIASGGSKGINLALVAVEATIFSLNAIANSFWNNDMRNANKQLGMLTEAFADVQTYAKEFGLPDDYCTPEQLLYIANYVLQRENVTKDPVIKKIGDEIRAKINYKYSKEIEQCPKEY